MARTIFLDQLLRLTLTRKGKAIAKHPLLREGVIEAIKASVPDDEPLWTAIKAEQSSAKAGDGEPESDEDGEDADWYGDFAAYIVTVPAEDIPEDWEEAFASYNDAAVKAGKKKNNYPSSRGPFAGPHNSFPIKTQQDVYDAARLIGHASNPGAVRARIISIARSRGYKLPKSWAKKAHASEADTASKSWQKATKGSMDTDELVAKLSDAIKGLLAPAAPETPQEAEAPDETEKAKGTTHSHEHPHSSMRGYGYSHTHDHGHGSMDDHDVSDSAHGHDHTSKAEELDPAIKADLEGMDADIQNLKERVQALETEKAALVASLQAKDAELASKAQAAEEATADAAASKEAHTAIKAELDKATDEARVPLTAAPPSTEKAQKPIKDMSFDDAFSALLHR